MLKRNSGCEVVIYRQYRALSTACGINISLNKFADYFFIKLPPVLLSRDGTGSLTIRNPGT